LGQRRLKKHFIWKSKVRLNGLLEADKDWVVVEPSEGSSKYYLRESKHKKNRHSARAYESRLSILTKLVISSPTPIITVKMSVVSRNISDILVENKI